MSGWCSTDGPWRHGRTVGESWCLGRRNLDAVGVAAGDGEYRGGLGVETALYLREGESYLIFLGDRAHSGPYGLEGGGSGATADHEFHTDGKYFQAPHKSRLDNLYLKPGEGMIVRTPGGGYGEPSKQSPEARANDTRRGYLGPSAQAAE